MQVQGLQGLVALGCPWRTQDAELSASLGAALVVTGTCACSCAGWVAVHLVVQRPRLPTHLLLLQLDCTALFCSLLAGFPFIGPSAIAGYWLFGARGCVTVSILQQTGVAAQMWTLAALALERRSQPPLSARWYARALLSAWVVALLVATPPLLGWGSIGCDVSGVSCGVKWAEAGQASTYAVFALSLGRILPAAVTVRCLCAAAASGVRGATKQDRQDAQDSQEPAFGQRLQVLTATSRLTAAGILLLRAPRLLLDVYLAASGVPWSEAPRALAILAPLSDEASGSVLPLVCLFVDPRVRPRCASASRPSRRQRHSHLAAASGRPSQLAVEQN